MNDEQHLADELQATKDDPTEWGAPVPASRGAGRTKRRLAAMVSVRLSPEELEAVQARAQDLGMSVSAYLRRLVLRDASGAQKNVAGPHVTASTPGTSFGSSSTSYVRVEGALGAPR
jgi:hypothetical protein